MHEALAVCRPEIPQPDGLVEAPAEEGFVGGRHAERHDSLAVSAKVADVLVLRDVKVADDVVLLGAGVHDVRLVGREVDEVDAILLGVERPPLGSSLTVVDDDLVVVRGGDEGGAVRREVQVVDRVLVLLEDLADPHGADHVVDELHLDDLGRWLHDHLLFLALRRRRGRFGAAACEHRQPGQRSDVGDRRDHERSALELTDPDESSEDSTSSLLGCYTYSKADTKRERRMMGGSWPVGRQAEESTEVRRRTNVTDGGRAASEVSLRLRALPSSSVLGPSPLLFLLLACSKPKLLARYADSLSVSSLFTLQLHFPPHSLLCTRNRNEYSRRECWSWC